MKNLFKMSAVLAVAVMTLAGCNCFKKMAKNQDDVKLTCTPEVLALNNGKVEADITVTFPQYYFNKKAVIKVTPVMVFGGGMVEGATKYFQGDKVKENYTVVSATGGQFTQHVEFPYEARMANSELRLLLEVKCPKGKCKEFTLVNLNNGAIPTKEEAAILAGDDAAAKAAIEREFGLVVAYGLNTLQKDIKYGDLMENMANNYKRVTTVVNKTDLLYAINSSKVTKKNQAAADLDAFKADVDEKLGNDRATQNIAVKGYASPDGPEKFNDKLSEKRSKTGLKAVEKLLADAGLNIDAAAYGEDWEGFQAAVAASNIADKDLILQVLKMYSSSAEREKEIKNMSTVFKSLKTDVLPQLRRAQVVNSADVTGWSDEEMVAFIKEGKASTLKLEELLHIASVCDCVAEAALVEATKSGDARAWNNLALVYAKAGNYEKAVECLNKADKSVASELNNNYAMVYAAEGDVAKADTYAANASAEAKALIAAAKGDYATAAQTLRSGYNAAIVNFQNGNLSAAKKCIASDNSAKADYLRAVIAVKEGNVNNAKAQLNSAISKDASLAAKAKKDVNLVSLF